MLEASSHRRRGQRGRGPELLRFLRCAEGRRFQERPNALSCRRRLRAKTVGSQTKLDSTRPCPAASAREWRRPCQSLPQKTKERRLAFPLAEAAAAAGPWWTPPSTFFLRLQTKDRDARWLRFSLTGKTRSPAVPKKPVVADSPRVHRPREIADTSLASKAGMAKKASSESKVTLVENGETRRPCPHSPSRGRRSQRGGVPQCWHSERKTQPPEMGFGRQALAVSED